MDEDLEPERPTQGSVTMLLQCCDADPTGPGGGGPGPPKLGWYKSGPGEKGTVLSVDQSMRGPSAFFIFCVCVCC